MTYFIKQVLVIKDDTAPLRIDKHIETTFLNNLAEAGAALIWDYKGLKLLLCNASLKNYVRTPSVLTSDSFIQLPTYITALLLDN